MQHSMMCEGTPLESRGQELMSLFSDVMSLSLDYGSESQWACAYRLNSVSKLQWFGMPLCGYYSEQLAFAALLLAASASQPLGMPPRLAGMPLQQR